MRRLGALVLALALASPALAALVDVPVGGGTCTLAVDVVRCSGAPAPAPTRTPGPVSPPAGTPVYAACPPGSPGSLDRAFDTQPTLRGYANVTVTGKTAREFCFTQVVPTTRGGNVGAAWLDSGSQCTNLRINLVASPGNVTSSTGWSGTPQLTYKLLFPGFVAPSGVYRLHVESDSSACPGGQGRYQIIWTP